MTFWLVLLLIVIAVSYILAYLSMKSFSQDTEYSVFLIKKREVLTKELLQSIYTLLKANNQMLAIERLIKGDKSTLVICGSRKLLLILADKLGLIEVEDYTTVDFEKTYAWALSTKEHIIQLDQNFMQKFPSLEAGEQFWWQVVIKPSRKTKTSMFATQMRAVYTFSQFQRGKQMRERLQNLTEADVFKVQKDKDLNQVVQLYKGRIFESGQTNAVFNLEDILKLSVGL